MTIDPRDSRFIVVWMRLQRLHLVDTIGGAEFRRRLRRWINDGRPREHIGVYVYPEVQTPSEEEKLWR